MTTHNTHARPVGALLGAFLLSAAFAPAAVAGNSGTPSMPGYTPDLLPGNPQAGLCYARVEIPAQYRSETERVAVKDGYEDLQIEQAQLTTRQEQVEIKEASTRFEVRQPTFRTVSEQIMTRPAYDKLTVKAPKFETKTSCVNCSAPRLVWKRGNPGKLMAQGYRVHGTADAGQGGRGYSSTAQYGQSGGQHCGDGCEIWCLVEVPGEQVQYNRQVIVKPASVERQTVPAQYRSITKQVVADPGGVREIPVPAQYRTITVEELVAPARANRTMVPTQYGNVEKKVLVEAERYEWRQVVCKPGTQSMRSPSSYSNTSSYSTSSYSAPTTSYTAPATPYSGGSSVPLAGGQSSGGLYSSGANGEWVPTYNNGITSGAIASGSTGRVHLGHQSMTGAAHSGTHSQLTCKGAECNPYEGRPARRRRGW